MPFGVVLGDEPEELAMYDGRIGPGESSMLHPDRIVDLLERRGQCSRDDATLMAVDPTATARDVRR